MNSSLHGTVAPCCVAPGLPAGGTTLPAEVAKEAVNFKDGDRVCFVGCSITHGGGFGYHSQITLFYATRFPQMRIGYWNCGIAGDSALGAVRRYAWDIAPHKPTVATIMLGMNDVTRRLYAMDASGPEVEAQRQEAIEMHAAKMAELAERLTQDGAKLIFITPSIYDQTGNQEIENLVGVNVALGICGYEARKLASKYNAGVADVHLLMSRVNATGQAKDPNYTITGADRIHSGAPGHLVMAYAFLKAQGMSSCVSRVELNASKQELAREENCSVENLRFTDGTISFDCLENALPFPVESEAEPAFDRVPFTEDLNQELLTINGLEAGDYELLIDGQGILKRSAVEFAQGVNLALVSGTPQYKQALQVLADLKTRAEIYSSKLRQYAFIRHWERHLNNGPDEAELQEAADALLEKAYSENQPKSHRFELRSVR